MKCNYCSQIITKNLTLKEIFLAKRISDEQLCLQCFKKFQELSQKDCCYGCQRPDIEMYCQDCLSWREIYPDYLFHHETLFSYNQAMQEWFEEYKFKGNYNLRFSFVEPLQQYFKNKKHYLIIPMPISNERMNTRGFNQVEGLLEAAGIPYKPYLVRITDGISQVQKTRKERLNLIQPFSLTEIGKQAVQGQEVLLIDDIYTTGRTIFHAAQAILENSPVKLNTFSLAR